MTTRIGTRPASPFSLIQDFCSSVGSLCERTNAAFRRVHVEKKDENGNLKLYNVTDPDTGKAVKDPATGKVKKKSVITYIEDIRTGNLYLDEEAHVVAFKCFVLVFAIPFYTVGKMAWHLFKIPCGLFQSLEIVGNNLLEVVKAPLFGIGAELAAIGGIIKPYKFRTWEAIVENKWQNGVSYKEDFRKIPPRKGENCWQAFMKDIRQKRPLYLAYCFQVRGNVNDPRIHVIRRESLR
jgi:hypothetical protein